MSTRKTQEEFERDARIVHGDKYDYSESVYVNNVTKVLIKCNACGTKFWQKPNGHLSAGRGCPNCARELTKKNLVPNPSMGKDEFVRKAMLVHGEDYDYANVDYIDNSTKVCIICKKCGREFWQTPNSHLNGSGCSFCWRQKVRAPLFGVGINDVEDVMASDGSKSPAYIHWQNMLNRCYNTKRQKVAENYKDCSVCEEWKYFSNFKRWFEDPINGYKDGYELDKDILFKGNRVYSPDTCCLVPNYINSLLIKQRKIKSKYGRGVWKNGNRYTVYISKHNKRVHVGTFNTIEEAFAAYKREKESYIKEVAQEYFDKGEIDKRVYDALTNYKVEITD